jgi:hypothetical protein
MIARAEEFDRGQEAPPSDKLTREVGYQAIG